MSVQKGERRKMYDNIDYSVEVNFIKRLAPSASRYNFRSGGSRVNTAALRKLSQYRKLRWQERKLKEDICEMPSQLAAVGEHCGRVAHRGKKLTDLWLDLAKVQLRLRECEELAAKMPKRYRGVVKSRYFDGSKKHPPEWGSSAAEFGFPFGGEELRRQVTKCLNEICN